MARGAGRSGEAQSLCVVRQRTADARSDHQLRYRTRSDPSCSAGGRPASGGGVSMSIPALAPTWVPVCGYDVLLPERGVAVLVDGEQIALFRLADGTVRAVGNRDPFSGAYVLSRGIVGSRGDVPTVASPMLKQV